MLNLFKKNNNEKTNEINNEELKQKIKNMAIDILIKNNRINNADENDIIINFKYLDKTKNGLQSMFIICVNSNNFYFNISNDKSLIGRELLMPDELMRFKLGEGLFMATRQYPIKSNFIPISNYGFKIKMSVIPKKQKDFKIDCFNLDEFRKKKIQDEEDKKVDLV